MGWAVVYTAPREEGGVRERLSERGYGIFLPLLRLRKGGTEPLFTRYLFVDIERQWRSILGTRGVVSLIMDGDRPAWVRVGVMRELQARADTGGVLTLEGFRRGAAVRVTRGAMRGMEGLYRGMTRKERCAVLMQMLGSARTIEVLEADLELA